MPELVLTSPYVTFDYYRDVFKGTAIPEDSFLNHEEFAEAVLHRITFNRILRRPELITDDILANIKNAICAMADVDYQENRKTPGVKSETTDGYSVTYGDSGNTSGTSGRVSMMHQAAKTYLHDTGLLFKGRSRKYDLKC